MSTHYYTAYTLVHKVVIKSDLVFMKFIGLNSYKTLKLCLIHDYIFMVVMKFVKILSHE